MKVNGYKGTAKLTLLNSIGQVVINESEIVDDNTSIIVKLATCSKGIYWLKVETLDEQYVEKIILY